MADGSRSIVSLPCNSLPQLCSEAYGWAGGVGGSYVDTSKPAPWQEFAPVILAPLFPSLSFVTNLRWWDALSLSPSSLDHGGWERDGQRDSLSQLDGVVLQSLLAVVQ
jgi:hypothetical protein